VEFTKDEISRFQEKYVVSKQDDCWVWSGGRYETGYGMFFMRRGSRKTFSAHRVSWQMKHGKEVPAGMLICHTCDNRLCVNPDHLYAGTHRDNNRDTIKRNRGNRKYGSNCSWAKVTERDVLEIRESNEKQTLLAKKFGISASQICHIRKGRRWGDVSNLV